MEQLLLYCKIPPLTVFSLCLAWWFCENTAPYKTTIMGKNCSELGQFSAYFPSHNLRTPRVRASPRLYWLSLSHALEWRHNERDGVSNHLRLDCLLNRLFRRRSKETSKLRVTGLCGGKFPAQRSCNAGMFPFHDVIMPHITQSRLKFDIYLITLPY